MRRFWSGNGLRRRAALMLCALTLVLHGCASSAALTSGLPPDPTTPGAIITDDYICIPHDEAGELQLWIEQAEGL